MSSTVFYRSALARELSPDVKALMQSLLSRSEQIDALEEELPAQILANRSRREGKPVTLTKSAKRTIQSFAEDSREAITAMPALVARVRSEIQLVRIALQGERTDLLMDQAVYSAGHPEDRWRGHFTR